MNDQKKNKNQLAQPAVRIEVGDTVLEINSQSESNFPADLRAIQRLLDGCISEYLVSNIESLPHSARSAHDQSPQTSKYQPVRVAVSQLIHRTAEPSPSNRDDDYNIADMM